MLFLSGRDSWLVFSRREPYRLVRPFSTSVLSPWDQRGNPGSRNRGLGIAIWAENGLVWDARLCGERISSCQQPRCLSHCKRPCESSQRRNDQRFPHTCHRSPFETGELT